jgi:hypothetical protein
MKIPSHITKKFSFLLAFGMTIGCLTLVGCSKSANTKSSSGTSANPNSADLKIKWVVGKKYVMRMEMNQDSQITPPGQPKPVEQSMDMTQDFDMSALKELPNGGRELELEFKAMTMDVTVGDRQMMGFDSSVPAEQDSSNSVAPMLRKMVGARIQYFTDANGKVEKVEGGKELVERMTEGTQQPGQAIFSKSMFSEDTLKQYGSFGDGMPDHPVKIGDSWHMVKKISNPIGELTLDLECTFKGWEQHGDRQCARIDNTGSISSSGDSTMPNMSVKIKNGKISGEGWYDPDLGMVVDGTSDQDMTMIITAQEKPMTMQMKQKIRFSLVKTEDLVKN